MIIATIISSERWALHQTGRFCVITLWPDEKASLICSSNPRAAEHRMTLADVSLRYIFGGAGSWNNQERNRKTSLSGCSCEGQPQNNRATLSGKLMQGSSIQAAWRKCWCMETGVYSVYITQTEGRFHRKCDRRHSHSERVLVDGSWRQQSTALRLLRGQNA